MNEFFERMMTFINENTYLLIGICIFLILVLIGYLIDNSVKSKRVRKDIKNKDQVPENIKNEIIKEAMNENKEKIMENSFHNAVREESENSKNENVTFNNQNLNIDDGSKIELNLDEISSNDELNASMNLDEKDISVPFSLDGSESLNNNDENSILSEPLILSSNSESSDLTVESENNVQHEEILFGENSNLTNSNSNEIENESLIIDTPVSVDLNPSDPDANIMVREESKYKNNKKLSEILLEVDKSRISGNKDNLSLFEDDNKIEINTNAAESKVEIETDDSIDELDKIMKKLSSMSNEDEDNYTNIF